MIIESTSLSIESFFHDLENQLKGTLKTVDGKYYFTFQNGVISGEIKGIEIESDIVLIEFSVNSKEQLTMRNHLHMGHLSFCLCSEGNITTQNSQIDKPVTINNQEGLLISSIKEDLVCDFNISNTLECIWLDLPINKIHELFNTNLQYSFSNKGLFSRFEHEQFIQFKLNPTLNVILSQIIRFDQKSSISRLYFKGKILEFLALYFSELEQANNTTTGCPFINHHDDLKSIQKAKEILIADITNPPSIQKIAHEVGINEYKLKVGFKEIYKNTLYGYLLEHKMEMGRKMLEDKKYQVKQVANMLGYNNPSHFITAFKKQFNITPKKFLQGIDQPI